MPNETCIRSRYVASLAIILSAAWQVLPMTDAGDLEFKKHVINDQTDYSAAALIDVNHDGRLDVVCGGDWYEAPDWKPHFVAKIPRIAGRPDGFAHLAFDVNRDGWVDVITVNYRSRSIKWMEHPGPTLGPWAMHIAAEPGAMETGRLVDIDGDGRVDLLPNGAKFAAWWEFRWNDEASSGAPAWIRHDLPEEARGHGLGFGDINGDGRGDIVAQNGWLSAPSDARNGTWEWHPDFKIERGSIPMIVVDVDEDGDNDVVWCSAHGLGVYWLEQTSDSDQTRNWHRHAIDTSWSQGHAPLWVDLDGDGRNELVAGKRYMSHGGADPGAYDPIAVYRYQFNPATRTWDRWTVSAPGQRIGLGLDPKVADMDNDGDLDLMASGRSGVYWLENLGPKESPSTDPPSYVDHQDLSVVVRGGKSKPISGPEDWGFRRSHVLASVEAAHRVVPGPRVRSPLDIVVEGQESHAGYTAQTIRYRIDADREVTAELWVPNGAQPGATNGIVCMFDTEHLERAGIIAAELAERGSVCLVPRIVSDTTADPILDGVWQAMRAADVLQAVEWVHGERIGLVSDALHGQLGVYAGAFDQRFVAIIADAQSATQSLVSSTATQYSVAELIAAAAPRALTILLPDDADSASTVKMHADAAREIFRLRRVPQNLVVSPAWLEPNDREGAYTWLNSNLGR